MSNDPYTLWKETAMKSDPYPLWRETMQAEMEKVLQAFRDALGKAVTESGPQATENQAWPKSHCSPQPATDPLSVSEREELRQLREARDAILPVLQQIGIVPGSTIQLTAAGARNAFSVLAARMKAAEGALLTAREHRDEMARTVFSLEEKLKSLSASLKTLVWFAQNCDFDDSENNEPGEDSDCDDSSDLE